MEKLKDIVHDGQSLSEGLRKNGLLHQSYKLYTSMERALGILVSGYLYLSNGSRWNDIADKNLMRIKNAYALSFSCSTKENIAMWMLYGANNGKQGAMLNFYPSIIKALVKTESVDLGKFDEHGQFDDKYKLNKRNYAIFMSDVVYTDICHGERIKLTIGDEHITTDEAVLENKDVFRKNYAWSYEKECRLIVRLNEKWSAKAEREQLSYIRIQMPIKQMNKMKDNRLVRSPIYEGGVATGTLSLLTDDVNWNLN